MLKILLLHLLLLAQLSVAQENRPVVALQMSGQNDSISDSNLDIVQSAFENELIKTQKFKVIERTKVNELLKEQSFQQSGVCDAEHCQVEMGKILGVEKLLIGSLSQKAEILYFQIKLVNVESGLIETSQTCSVEGELSDLIELGLGPLAQSIADPSEDDLSKNLHFKPKFPWLAWITGLSSVALTTGILWYFLESQQANEKRDYDERPEI